jgi:type VI secretion system protein ImpF
MARIDEEVRLHLSVLDRLIDFEPDVKAEPPLSRSKSLRQLKQALRRDLEWLLNTRCTLALSEDLGSLADSLLSYGLPDFSTMSVRNAEDQNDLVRALETALRRFEPRLEDVVVTVAGTSPLERALRFRIEARLRIDPVPEPVAFDTTLVLGSGSFAVKGD